MAFEKTYTDPDGQNMRIRDSADHAPGALLRPLSENIIVPAHRLAEFCGSLYQAAGQPVPDLPVIADPAMVDELTAITSRHFREADNIQAVHRAAALDLLAAGWRKS